MQSSQNTQLFTDDDAGEGVLAHHALAAYLASGLAALALALLIVSCAGAYISL